MRRRWLELKLRRSKNPERSTLPKPLVSSQAVTENLDIKRTLLAKVAVMRAPGTIISTNTSGIPLASISDGFEREFRQHFLGTHFFNPPRYLHLLEMIPGADTSPQVLDFVRDFCDRRLGKGVVACKDTPNFIANRIGTFFGSTVHKITVEDDYTIEEVDALTGPPIGLPKSASYRLLDIVGLDVWALVTKNLHDLAPHDPWRERFVLQPFLAEMIQRGWLGEKRGQGCYKRVGKGAEIWGIDWKTLEYHAARRASFPSLDAAKNVEDLGERLRMLLSAQDRAGQFLWKLFSDLFLYSASMVPEISDRVDLSTARPTAADARIPSISIWRRAATSSLNNGLEFCRSPASSAPAAWWRKMREHRWWTLATAFCAWRFTAR